MSDAAMRPGLHVMVVDDNPSDVELVGLALDELPTAVRLSSAADGRAGLERLQGSPVEELPDLVLLDLNMPQMSGWDLLRRIREDPRLTRLHVVIFSTSESFSDRQLGVELGADDIITKPARFAQLRDLLASLVERYARPR